MVRAQLVGLDAAGGHGPALAAVGPVLGLFALPQVADPGHPLLLRRRHVREARARVRAGAAVLRGRQRPERRRARCRRRRHRLLRGDLRVRPRGAAPEHHAAVAGVGHDDAALGHHRERRAGAHARHVAEAEVEARLEQLRHLRVHGLEGRRERRGERRARRRRGRRLQPPQQVRLHELGHLPATVPVEHAHHELPVVRRRRERAVLHGAVRHVLPDAHAALPARAHEALGVVAGGVRRRRLVRVQARVREPQAVRHGAGCHRQRRRAEGHAAQVLLRAAAAPLVRRRLRAGRGPPARRAR
mmetsp:Transcript_33548/g.105994  ORF Transcript_33548/g.105994 Transcript_33548/m.105994 type:complete len:301 (+) Transcript_33548:1027-1929(+)